MNEIDKIKELTYWVKYTNGIFRYVIAAKAAYELIVLYQNNIDEVPNENTITRCDVYITGNWKDEQGNLFFSREKLNDKPLSYQECLDLASEDFITNMQ